MLQHNTLDESKCIQRRHHIILHAGGGIVRGEAKVDIAEQPSRSDREQRGKGNDPQTWIV